MSPTRPPVHGETGGGCQKLAMARIEEDVVDARTPAEGGEAERHVDVAVGDRGCQCRARLEDRAWSPAALEDDLANGDGDVSEFAALLHGVGKIAVPKEIVNKPGKLDDREWAIIRTHTLEGQKMLERVGGFMSEVGEIVRASHERWDGGGYPDGLRGGAIPLEARIVSCCDAFNAMTTTRSYRRAMPVSAALAELIDNAGTQFDPRVVDALVQVVG